MLLLLAVPVSVAALLLLVPVPVVSLVVAEVVPEAAPVPEAEPEIEPDALTPALVVPVSVAVDVDEALLSTVVLLELDAAGVVSLAAVLVFVSTEQPVNASARAAKAAVPRRVKLFFFMVCLPKVGVE